MQKCYSFTKVEQPAPSPTDSEGNYYTQNLALNRTRPVARRSLSLLIACLVITITSLIQPANAGIVNATNADTTAIAATLNDAVVNCDMALSPSSLGMVKAIVYGDGEQTGGSGSIGQGGIFVVDYYGNTASINLPPNAVQPDVAIANTGMTSANVLYQVVVTYCIGPRLYVGIYDLHNLGFSSTSSTPFSITAPLTSPTAIVNNCNGYPHIDMWSDNGLMSYGGSMHEYAVVWSQGSTQDLYCYHNDVTSTTTPPAFSLGGRTSCRMPDVACFMNVNVSSSLYTHQFLEVTYGVASSTTAPVNDLKVEEFDASASYTSSGPTLLFSGTSYSGAGAAYGAVYAPRIEAEGLYGGDANELKYEVVADIQVSSGYGPYTVMGFNDNYLSGYSLSSTQFTPPNDICMAACVAAGLMAGNTTLSIPIGNNQYTAGFWNSNSTQIYTRDIAAATSSSVTAGDLISPTTWYEVNLSTDPIGYSSQIAKNVAISNCSNEGDDILTAWFDGTNIMYKHSTSNLMAFRMAPQRTGPAILFPNPVAAELHVQNAMEHTNFAVLDMSGRIVLSGKLDDTNMIGTSKLTEGNYILRVLSSNRVPQSLRFIKI